MSDCISRELLLSGLNDIRQTYKEAKNFDAVSAIDNAIGEVKDTPVVDEQKVKHWKWILEREPDGIPYCFHCSVCDDDFGCIGITTAYDYCPNCGAKMDWEEGKQK